ncbi:hypothetical protein [Nocardia sp. NPDC005366]|uniref:hypothetical protein n=1 Tax=Nocardia sp. NPDC005366 TaxID=3156878 RepID=UPI0033AC8685
MTDDTRDRGDVTPTREQQEFDIAQARALILATPAIDEPDVISAVLRALTAVRDL